MVSTRPRPTPWIALALAAVTIAVYLPVAGHEFLRYDDDVYVTANPAVQGGLTPAGIAWAFTTGHAANWHPLTWMSHMADVSLFGSDPRGPHLVNLALHVLNSILLFLLLQRATQSSWKSAFVAALFALHPLHVESVAWIAERKDVLSTFFWFLGMLAYLGYVERPGAGRYLGVVAAFVLGLLSKPMLVTFPFVLLVLDVWPLRRLGAGAGSGRSGSEWGSLTRLVLEKAPLILLAIAAGVVTFLVQRSGGAVAGADTLSVGTRVANAIVSYGAYLWKMVWPLSLGVLYPVEFPVPAWKVLAAGLVIAGITALAVRLRSRSPYLLTGWLLYLGTLVPVIGIVQVGVQSFADRYTYVPLVGPFIMLAWGIPDLLRAAAGRSMRTGAPPRSGIRSDAALPVAAAAVLLAASLLTARQAGFWKDSRTLFEHTVAVTKNNFVMHNNLGGILARQGDNEAALVHFAESHRIRPDYPEAISNMGILVAAKGLADSAVALQREALRLNPSRFETWLNLGYVQRSRGDLAEAEESFREALRLSPGRPEVLAALQGPAGGSRPAPGAPATMPGTPAPRDFAGSDPAASAYERGNALRNSGHAAEALDAYREALRLRPDYPEAMNNIATLLGREGRADDAIGYLREALKAHPDFTDARINLGTALAIQDRLDEAYAEFSEVLRHDPGNVAAHYNLGLLLARHGKRDEAIEHLESALRGDPDHAGARHALEQLRGPGP